MEEKTRKREKWKRKRDEARLKLALFLSFRASRNETRRIKDEDGEREDNQERPEDLYHLLGSYQGKGSPEEVESLKKRQNR